MIICNSKCTGLQDITVSKNKYCYSTVSTFTVIQKVIKLTENNIYGAHERKKKQLRSIYDLKKSLRRNFLIHCTIYTNIFD